MTERLVLNVGGGSPDIALPKHYAGWTQHLLDIDPAARPDILCDARTLASTEYSVRYDAVYCSHNIEHYFPHDVPKVLAGFIHVLKPDGFSEIRCPDLGAVMKAFVDRSLDIESTLYVSTSGPITVRDVIYGFGQEIERSGNDYYAHKTGFTVASLQKALQRWFPAVAITSHNYELAALAFKSGVPTDEQLRMFGLPPPPKA